MDQRRIDQILEMIWNIFGHLWPAACH